MEVKLENIGRRFNEGWIFRQVNETFKTNEHVVIKGANGSGKSTLLQIIFGNLTSSEGKVKFSIGGKEISADDMVHKVTMCSPYLQLIEEFTLTESLEFQAKLIPFRNNLSTDQLLEILGLREHAKKPLKSFSSGMRQRVKLVLAILADTEMVLLDEPAMNLDAKAIEWYVDLVNEHCGDRLFIVCSNSAGEEFPFCKQELDVMRYK